ncbi:MAG TPA: antibiotic biosynthesis monooxygenase [Dehalococcoidales bacterium]|nr:antibiotic biosynthesis monooxygenase [Dehalococcoidales bacterium]
MNNDVIVPAGKSTTVVVSRNVSPGREREYDEWVRRLVAAATRAPGNRGATMLIPEPGKRGLYHVVLRFADRDSVATWENSNERKELSNEADAFSRSSRQEATGLETWFSIPECPELAPPPRWKMSVVAFIAAYVLTIIIVPLELRYLESWAFPVLNILTCVLLVILMTYAVMPFLSRFIFRHWLYR